jgi:Beta-ketoacyl synthase, N-terminal domain
VAGVAVWGPGLEGWAASQPILAGERDYTPGDVSPPVPAILPANERRRAGAAVRLALAVAQQATEMAGVPPGGVRSIFASSNSDGAVVHAILESLAGPDRQISPTQFHNSVHNAAAGYWTIATGSGQAASSIGCHDATFAAGLLMAAADIATEGKPVLLCAYDLPLPSPLCEKRRTTVPFAAGLVLAPMSEATQPGKALVELGLEFAAEAPAIEDEAPSTPQLAALALANPAARSLRLLQAIAGGVAARLAAGLLDGRVEIEVRPV